MPPDDDCSLHAPVTAAANAINKNTLIQLGIDVSDWPGFIVLNLFVARTAKGLEHETRV
jgi:hypothetical protein